MSTAHLIAVAASHPATASVASAIASAASSATTGAANATGGVGSFITTTVPSIVASILPSGVTTTAPDAFGHGVAVTVPPMWEYLAVFAGALSGGLSAVRHKFDVVGILTLAIVTGLGGGIIRDVLLQRFGIAAFQDNLYLLTAIAGAALVFFFSEFARRLRKPLLYVDAVSLGLFVVVGADKALRADMNLLPAIMMGVITATGGSVVRDLLTDEVPTLLRPGALYALAALVGSAAFVLATVWLGVVKEFAALFAIVLAVGLRVLAMWRGWQTPTARDYSRHVAVLPRRVLRAFGLGRRPEPIERDEDVSPREHSEHSDR